jgi:uncharacterized iron-regulated membrane protein
VDTEIALQSQKSGYNRISDNKGFRNLDILSVPSVVLALGLLCLSSIPSCRRGRLLWHKRRQKLWAPNVESQHPLALRAGADAGCPCGGSAGFAGVPSLFAAFSKELRFSEL